jgi:hypothetical protein
LSGESESFQQISNLIFSLLMLDLEQSHDVITQTLEMLVDNSVIHEEVIFESLLIGSSFGMLNLKFRRYSET